MRPCKHTAAEGSKLSQFLKEREIFVIFFILGRVKLLFCSREKVVQTFQIQMFFFLQYVDF